MVIFRVQIICLLLSVANYQRSQANPTTNLWKLSEWPDLKGKDAFQSLDEKNGKDAVHHWQCQPGSDYIQQQISLTRKLLSDGEKVMHKQQDLLNEETILVVGKAGSGKTSLVQFLTENPKLQSKPVRAETGEFIIEDGEKIGTSVTESFTLYPELVSYNGSFTFCDSPGFHDSRSSAHEVVSMNIMKTTTNRFKNLRILLLENYSSLQYGLYKDNFVNTLRHLVDLLVDIDKYKDHIVLVATKIPLTYVIKDEGDSNVQTVTEEMHIGSIVEYLNHTETSIAEKVAQETSLPEKEFYQKVIKILQSLQARDENGKASRINVFRRPYKSGSLENMPLMKNNKESLMKTIMNLDVVEVGKSDFDFTLSDKAQLYLECLLKLMSDNYQNKINEMSFKVNEFVNIKTQNYRSFHQVLSDLESLYGALKHLSVNLDETKNYNEFFEKVNSFSSDQKIFPQINYNEQMHVVKKYEEMLLKFLDTNVVFAPASWTLPIRQVIKSTEDELQWYRSLNKFINGLASFKVQKNKTEIFSKIFLESSISTNELMSLFGDITGNTNLKQFIDAQGDNRKRIELESITKTLLKQSNITCDANGRLVVKGFQICISEVNLEDLAREHCDNVTVKEVALLAVDTVFLDEDTVDSLREVNMFIAAPKWEVVGERRRIVLTGKPGPDVPQDTPYADNGKDGRPGLPGGNGRSFFGIGLQFANGKSLRIESNGGRGGSGAQGAKGDRGSDGRDASEKMSLGTYSHIYRMDKGFKTSRLANLFLAVQEGKYEEKRCDIAHGNIYAEVGVVIEDGDCGERGAAGGLGGGGGLGGLAGDQQLIELGAPSEIEMQRQTGDTGANGMMGETGDRGTDGIGMICIQVQRERYDDASFWSCGLTYATSPVCKTCMDDATQLDRLGPKYTTGIEQPAPKKSPDFGYYLLDYSVLLETHSDHTIFKETITAFQTAFKRTFSYNLNDLGSLFFKARFQNTFSYGLNDLGLLFFKGDVKKPSQSI
ncbi:uncharacterized protein LOC111060002 [Nilaparvata lugens]|uniref:uncharacterized protein LOC111060002 n=1 Tax=Nilaparvata lugens TaxID=108931 RepID=UPI00193D4F25|nr:uncharacterized protein LOC111060002 [Nilaparvata lugens]